MADEKKNLMDMLSPQQRYSKAEIDEILADDPDEAPTEWVPTRFEKKINAIPEKQWTLMTVAGGVLIGCIVVATLFAGGKGVGAGFLIAVLLALVFPNMLEDRARRKVTKGRYAMIIVMAVGIAGMVLYVGLTKGWDSFMRKEAEPATSMLKMWMNL